jgi:hypothetical protein
MCRYLPKEVGNWASNLQSLFCKLEQTLQAGKETLLFSRVKASTEFATAQIVGYNHTHEQAQNCNP